jgi:transcriptional regulator with XRE-family HTH domain
MDVRGMRLRARLSQRQLADLSGIAQPNISAYESGRLTPSPATLADCAGHSGPTVGRAVCRNLQLLVVCQRVG